MGAMKIHWIAAASHHFDHGQERRNKVETAMTAAVSRRKESGKDDVGDGGFKIDA